MERLSLVLKLFWKQKKMRLKIWDKILCRASVGENTSLRRKLSKFDWVVWGWIGDTPLRGTSTWPMLCHSHQTHSFLYIPYRSRLDNLSSSITNIRTWWQLCWGRRIEESERRIWNSYSTWCLVCHIKLIEALNPLFTSDINLRSSIFRRSISSRTYHRFRLLCLTWSILLRISILCSYKQLIHSYHHEYCLVAYVYWSNDWCNVHYNH